MFEDLVIQNGSGSGGGGMFSVSCHARFHRCVFTGNRAFSFGGGILNYFGGIELIDCVFRGNFAESEGGGMVDDRSASTLVNCVFEGNDTWGHGGGLACMTGSTTNVTGTGFLANHANDGGAVFASASAPSFLTCTFEGNLADTGAAGLHNADSTPALTDCVFAECCQIWPPDSITDGGGNVMEPWCDECRANIDCRGNRVDAEDLAMLLAAWGTRDARCDLDDDGQVGGSDLGALFLNWGWCE